ncbi:MAG: hypothetical protein RL059_160 [Bacteroidota bacterium]|jgi:hypothetical protein
MPCVFFLNQVTKSGKMCKTSDYLSEFMTNLYFYEALGFEKVLVVGKSD